MTSRSKAVSNFDEQFPMMAHFDEETGEKVPSRVTLKEERHDNLFQTHKMRARESLDYRTADNVPLREFYQNNNTKGKSRFKAKLVATKWLIYFLIGILLGIVTFIIKWGVDALQDGKHKLILDFMKKDNLIGAFFMHYLLNMLYALVACAVVLFFGPMAGGSGIPEVKGYLNGVRVDGTINIKTFLGKILSIIPAYASCLSLGPEGPMVHIGGMIGAGLSGAKSRTLHIRLPGAGLFERLRTDKEQRDFMSSGVAAGIAAAFGAPIGGVLFALEEASSFWSRELTWRTFFGSMLSALSVNILFQAVKQHTISGTYASGGLLSFGLSRLYSYRYSELGPFMMLGVIGGLLGALFVKLNMKLNIWRRDHLSGNKILQFLEVAVTVTIFAMITFLLPATFGQCKLIPVQVNYANQTMICDNAEALNATEVYEGFCHVGYYNDWANLFMIPQDQAVKLLFSRSHDIFSYQALSVFLAVYFLMVVYTSGLSLAGGLFVPMMLVGEFSVIILCTTRRVSK
eukprot:TRINITY_DN4341_c0_g1_i2.p1 TRINITY_DN4341_c0_g1~~TRINITY_DN4341_c0_g1_i2.p1  ORF type:complete len:515 (-),score=88.76 TRINITY_DN4341_c0_g1_i2:94-1638(-)